MSKLTRLTIFTLSCMALGTVVVFIVIATQFNLFIVAPAVVSAAYLMFLVYTAVLHRSDLNR